MNPAIPLSSPAGGFDIGRLAAGIARRWILIVVMVAVGIAAGYWAQRLLTPTYASVVAVLLDPKRPGSIGDEGQFTNLYVDSTKIGSVQSIIQSAGLLQRVVKSENLGESPEFGAPMVSLLDKARAAVQSVLPFHVFDPPAAEPDTPEAREERALARLTKAVTVTRVNLTYVINIQVVANSAADAARLATAVSEAYLTDQVETKRAAVRKDTTWLSERLNETRSELLRSEEDVETIRKQYGLTETNQGPNASIDRQVITELTAQLVSAESEIAAQRAKYEQVERIRRDHGNLDTLPEVASSLTIHSLRAAQTDVARKIADLSARYTPNYSGLVEIQRDKKALDAQVNAEVNRIIDGIYNTYQTSISRRDEITRMLAKLIDATQGNLISEGRLKLREAQRVADANRAFYDVQLRRLLEAEQQVTRQNVEARVLSPAVTPNAPKFPKRGIFLGGGAGLGLLIGLCVSGLLMWLETRFVSIAWSEETLGLPVLGCLPLLGKRQLAVNGRELNIAEYLRKAPLSLFAEALRSVRAGLRNATPSLPRVIHVTSAVPGEGKSTVAAALATSAAGAGLRTVLVDLDIRNSSVSKLFNVHRNEGVLDVIEGTSTIRSAVRKARQLPLTVIGAGSSALLRPDAIGSPEFAEMIQKLASEYDLVILDSPPILAVADSVLIAHVSDATLFVVQWRTTPKEIVTQGIKVLRSNQAPLAGVVFNKVDFSKTAEYEGIGYGMYYGGIKNYASS